MIEFKVRDLTPGDEYTQDEGETWWKVESIVSQPRSKSIRINAECVGSQLGAIKVGAFERGEYQPTDLVIVR